MPRYACYLLICAALMSLPAPGPAATLEITGSCYFADIPFPQFMNLWQEGWSFRDDDGEPLVYARPDMPLGGYLFVYFRNTGPEPVTVNDAAVQGLKLTQVLEPSHRPERAEDRFYSSLLLSRLPQADIAKAKRCGWPAWWKAGPQIIPPGGHGELVIRLKRAPEPDRLDIQLLAGGQVAGRTVVHTRREYPRFGTIAFSPDLKTVHLYAFHPTGGAVPVRLLMDGQDVTAQTRIVSDPALPCSAMTLRPEKPLGWLSWHVFRAEYADGSAAMAGMRAWGHEMVYGVWSSPSGEGLDPETATKQFIADYKRHNINAVMPFVVGQCREYFNSPEGWRWCDSQGVRRMVHWPSKENDALFLFAMDEPDANDAAFRDIPEKERLGVLGQFLVGWTQILQRFGPNSPVLLNIDNTYKPENWYMYHQLADIPCVDPYHPEQLDHSYTRHPYYLGSHIRPTYVQAVTAISQSSGQPKPLHVILCSTQYEHPDGYLGRFPTPEEKRMEVYYAIGEGAKGLSYWWFAYDRFCRGLEAATSEAKALWNEIGLLGAEVRTAGPVITTSCPAPLETQASRYLWVRTLLSGTDTLAVITVNENAASDRLGTVVRPAMEARIRVKLPSWLEAADVFEVTGDGIAEVKWSVRDGWLGLEPGEIFLSRLIIATSDPTLRQRLQKRYDELFASNVASLKEERQKLEQP
ncbi:MAG: hypothetical protein KatS3mg024_2697 [Armatimonadota bacterium]|nr:MAG: hypothetical protein KatS3mg024_2697 [Armatimonadota bacterium]